MTRVSWVVLLGLMAVLAACSERFMAPPLPDLYKDPYDFAVEVPPYTGAGADMAHASGARDLTVTVPPTD